MPNDAHLIDGAFVFAICRSFCRFLLCRSFLRSFLGRGALAAAGGQGQGHETCHKRCSHFLFEYFLFHLFSSFVF